jgi:hypothetical protein
LRQNDAPGFAWSVQAGTSVRGASFDPRKKQTLSQIDG